MSLGGACGRPAETLEVGTTRGPGALELVRAPGTAGAGWVVLGHGAGGSRWSADVLAARDAAVGAGWSVALVEQPWRRAGRRVAPAPAALDEAWHQLLDALVAAVDPARWVLGGRSAGARVACRTAADRGALAVLALSFPLHPPGRPERSRAAELAAAAAGAPGGARRLLVVQGARDPMGTPEEVRAVAPPGSDVRAVPGAHALDRSGRDVASAVDGWLAGLPTAGT